MSEREVKEIAKAYMEGYKNGARNFIGFSEKDLRLAAKQSWEMNGAYFLPKPKINQKEE